MKISDGNSKIGKIPNLSMIPVADCGNCDACKADCYALKAWRQYPVTRKAWRENSHAFRSNPFKAVSEIVPMIRKTKPKMFRIHVAGDFISQNHVDAWALIATECTETKFLAFTKMFDLDYHVMPENVSIVFSMFPGIADVPQGYPIAWCDSDKAGNVETRIPDTAIECTGLCDACGMCWSLREIGRDVYFHNHA